MLEGNPYSELIKLIMELVSKNNPLPYLIGEVVSVSDLKIKIDNNLQIDKDDFYVSDGLANILEPNDKVLVFVSADKQDYVIVNKVVRL